MLSIFMYNYLPKFMFYYMDSLFCKNEGGKLGGFQQKNDNIDKVGRKNRGS